MTCVYSGHHKEESTSTKSSESRTVPGLSCLRILLFGSMSPKAVAGWSDIRNQQFEPDTGEMRKMRKVARTPEIRVASASAE